MRLIGLAVHVCEKALKALERGGILPALQELDGPHWMKDTRHTRQGVSLRAVASKALAVIR